MTFNPVAEKPTGRKEKKKARTSGGGQEAPQVKSVVAIDEGARPAQGDDASGRKPITSRITWP